ncbi:MULTISPECIES: hypothetical protein [unclassified Lysinibacillus]|uniref:hypothetical protein n=1 Tax=unclassified Lysinibacillus TaxID=2636778 RepID=UPI0037F4A340
MKSVVRVKDDSFPVRYDGVTYKVGEEIEVLSEHAKHSSFEVLRVIEEAEKPLTATGIKAKLDELGIDYKGNASREDLLELLENSKPAE